MFWNRSKPEFEKTNYAIEGKPGIIQAELAGELKIHRSTIARRLASMEEAGYLYSEDEKGGLWPFARKK